MILIAGYPIDCAVTESHVVDNEVTEHPVEKGADIADHVRARPVSVTLDGIVTDTPIGVIANQRGERSVTGRLVNKPSDEARALLIQIRNKREPVSIETSLGGYTNMMLERLEFPRAADDGDSLRFRATFKQVTLVTNARTVVRVSSAQPRAAKKIDRGNKATATVTQAPESPKPHAAVDTRRSPVRTVKSTNSQGHVPSGRVYVGA